MNFPEKKKGKKTKKKKMYYNESKLSWLHVPVTTIACHSGRNAPSKVFDQFLWSVFQSIKLSYFIKLQRWFLIKPCLANGKKYFGSLSLSHTHTSLTLSLKHDLIPHIVYLYQQLFAAHEMKHLQKTAWMSSSMWCESTYRWYNKPRGTSGAIHLLPW